MLGNAVPADDEKKATFDYWALGSRTNQPAGAWLQVAGAVADARGLTLGETTRLFALESMAMVDTVAPTCETKYRFHSWRPTTAIVNAGADGNDATEPDPSWRARANQVGGTPEHWSGHSSFSSTAASVLAGFFCEDAIPFTLVTDSGNGAARTLAGFSGAATEAGRSRVLGGLHFEFSNQAGATAGRAIAAEVLSKALLLQHGPTHDASCPR